MKISTSKSEATVLSQETSCNSLEVRDGMLLVQHSRWQGVMKTLAERWDL